MDSSYYVQQLRQTVNDFDSKLQTRSREVENSTDVIATQTKQLYDKIDTFKNDMQQAEEKQLAHENVITLQQRIYEQTSASTNVRKSIIGIVRDFDINLARKSTMTELGEQLWMNTSRYWLSYVLISMTAWVNNVKSIANDAVSEAVRRDPNKAALFYCLMNMRFGRNDVAKKWLLFYFNTLDPQAPDDDCAIVLQAYLHGVFGNDAELDAHVQREIKSWIDALDADYEAAHMLISAYYSFFESMTVPPTQAYPVLKETCANYEELNTAAKDAAKYAQFKAIAEQIVNVAALDEGDYKAEVDKVLIKLVNSYDEEEKRLVNQKKYYELVMSANGNIDEARRQFDNLNATSESDNLGMQMIRWAVYDDNVDTYVKKFSLEHTKKFLEGGVEAFSKKQKSERPATYNLSIDLWKGSVFPASPETAVQDLKHTFERKKLNVVLFNKLNTIMLILALSVLTIGIILAATAFNGAALAYGISCGVGGVFLIVFIVNLIMQIVAFPKRQAKAAATLDLALTEIKKFETAFENAETEKRELLDFVHLL